MCVDANGRAYELQQADEKHSVIASVVSNFMIVDILLMPTKRARKMQNKWMNKKRKYNSNFFSYFEFERAEWDASIGCE